MVTTRKSVKKPYHREPRTDYEAILPRIFADMAEGASSTDACARQGVKLTALLYHLGKNPALAEAYARARGLQAERLALEIVDLADQEPERGPDGSVDPGWEAYRRGRIDARKWTASKILPKKYGDRQEVEHSGGISYIAQVPTRPATSLEWSDQVAVECGAGDVVAVEK